MSIVILQIITLITLVAQIALLRLIANKQPKHSYYVTQLLINVALLAFFITQILVHFTILLGIAIILQLGLFTMTWNSMKIMDK